MKVCFVGIGSIGARHIRNLVEICDRNKEILEIDVLRSTAKALPDDICKAINNVYICQAEIKKDYDAIFITNPTHLHYETLKKLKDHAEKFFIEKPLVCNMEQDILKLDLPPNNIYYVACPLRHTKILQEAKKILKNHKPFSVRAISSSYLPEWRIGTDYRNTYSAHKEQGGGVCIDLIHEWDYLYSFFGKPLQVQHYAGQYSNLEIDSDDLAIYIAKYSNFLVELHLDYFGRKSERKLELFCKDGEYVFDIISNTVLKNGKVINQFQESPNDKYITEMEYFLELCKGNTPNINTLNHAMQVLYITMGVQR